MKSLFFGKQKYDEITSGNKYMKYRGVFNIILMEIKDEGTEEEKDINQYRLRKTLLAYIKLKYFQLINSYLLIGTKDDFIHSMLKYHLGPFELFGQIIYYMKELINRLVNKNYKKYKHLLNIDDITSYVNDLNDLYIFDDDFRDSIEMEVILKISLLLTIMEEFYKINMLKEFFKKRINTHDKNSFFDLSKDDLDSTNETKDENISKDLSIDDSLSDTPLPNPKNFIQYYGNNKHDIFWSENNLIEEYNLETTDAHNYIFITNKPFYQNITETPYKYVKKNDLKLKKKKLQEEKEKKKILAKKIKTKLDEEYMKLDSKFAKAIYIFFESHISKIEIRMSSNNTKDKMENIEKEKNIKLISENISNEFLKIKTDNQVQSAIEENELENKKTKKKTKKRNKKNGNENEEDSIQSEQKENNDEESDEIDEENLENEKVTFFIRPHLSFHLSEQSKNYFLNHVDRSNVLNKYSSLISFADYCAFEMMYNMLYINNSPIKRYLSKIELKKMQIINYVLILIENVFLMYHYFRSPYLTHDIYDVIDKSILYKVFFDIWIVLIIKLGIIFFVFVIYFLCKFTLVYQRNIIMTENQSFIFRKLGQEHQNMENPIIVNYFARNGKLLDTMDLINKNLGVFTKIKIVIFDSLITNLEINIFIFSFVLNVLFIMFGNPIILSIELLFIVGIYPSLMNILRAFTTKFSSIMICLFFTYCIIYIYSWLSIFYLQSSIDFGESFEYVSGQEINEPFCHSSVQCLMMLISYGTRSGGGIGDQLPVISFKNEFNNFVSRFFYDMSFYILVIMVMGNVTFGLIVDSFGALRDESYQYENDKNNICFICQLSRDGCLLKNINFDTHVQQEHNIWNYVDFLCYLHFYDANNFTKVESYVWEKLIEKNYEWIPIDVDAAAGDDEEGD